MAIVNVTPDSFSDGGDRFDPARAIADGQAMIDAGADILDIGGESTRPGAEAELDVEEELRRIVPVVQGLAAGGVPLSIDTRRAGIMRAALDAGAAIVNDVSALQDDPASLSLVAERAVPVILMHRRGTAAGGYKGPAYGDVVADVRDFLARRIDVCAAAGIGPERIALDPGLGFGKSVEENIRLVLGVPVLATLGCSILIGASRKSFVGRITGVETPRQRLAGSLAFAVEAARRGAGILRVHDVAATREALAVAQAFNRLDGGGQASASHDRELKSNP
jgi:dihydropteroate synthase